MKLGVMVGTIRSQFCYLKADLKNNIQKIGNLSSGLGVYTWEWNDIAKQMNIHRDSVYRLLKRG